MERVKVRSENIKNIENIKNVENNDLIDKMCNIEFLLFPNTEMQILFIPMPIKAKYLIGAYVLYEVYRGFNPIAGDNVAHWAHIGGALVGAIIVLVRRKINKSNFY